jgi:hypothetical protein
MCVNADLDQDGTFENVCQTNPNNSDGGVGTEISFQEADFIPTGLSPFDVLTADFNQDNQSDLVVSAGDIGVHVFINEGDAHFNDPGSFPSGEKTLGLATGDLDNDGQIDIVYLFEEMGRLKLGVALNRNGSPGVFDVVGTIDVESANTYEYVALADVNRDSFLDAVLWDFGLEIRVLQQDNSAAEKFPSPPQGLLIAGEYNQLIPLDINLDGFEDFVVTSNNGLDAYLNDAASPGSFQGPFNYLGDPVQWAVPLQANGDGRIDIAESTSNDFVTLLHSESDGIFLDPEHASDDALANSRFMAGDLDGNGSYDVVHQSGDIFLGVGGSPGHFNRAGRVIEEFLPNPIAVLFGDFGGDFKQDVVILDRGNEGTGQKGQIRVFVQQ